MRFALPASSLIHGAIVAALFIGFAWPRPEDAPEGTPVTVDIISLSAVSANTTETVQSDASQTIVSAGAEAAGAVTSDVLTPVESTPVTPVTQPQEPATAPTAAPVPPKAVEPLDAEPPMEASPSVTEPIALAELASIVPTTIAALSPATMANQAIATPAPPMPSQTLEPVSQADLKVAPMPQTLSIVRTSTPTYPERPTPPKPQAAEPQPAPRQQAAPAGNGGESDADATASNTGGQQGNQGTGGEAELARYPGQVLGELRRALRYPRDADGVSGEVHVQFVVSANGSASGIQVVRSSGNAAIDAAGIATVTRAAPFPAIPAGANRNSWTFTVPLAFQR